MRYLDIDKTIKAFEEQHGSESTLLNGYNADWILSFIESQHTADVQEVRHGSWKPCFEDWRKQIEGDECSACGFQHYGTNIRNYNYCPNCGAKMDKEFVE